MKKILIFALVFIPAVVSAQSWNLDRCVEYAQAHSIQVRQALLQQQQAADQITEAKDAFLPQVGASASQSFNFGRGLTSENTYANRNTSSFQWGASVQLPVFQGLRDVRNLKYSKINLQTLLYQVEEAKDNVTLNVISQYLQVLYNKELLSTAVSQVELSEYELERQKALAGAGKIAEVDILQATSQVAQDRQNVVEAENSVNQSLLDLAQLLQLPSADGFDIIPLPELLPDLMPLETVCENALNSNSVMKRYRNSITAAKANEDVARSGYIPTLSFNAGIGSSYYKLSGMENPAFHRQMRDNLNKYIGFSLSIPIFDGFSTRNALRRAKLQTTMATLQLEDAGTSLLKAIRQAHLQAESSLKKHEAALVTEEAARVSFSAMQEKYNMGRSNPYEFEQAKTAYLKARISTIQSRFEYQLRHRILEFYNNPRP